MSMLAVAEGNEWVEYEFIESVWIRPLKTGSYTSAVSARIGTNTYRLYVGSQEGCQKYVSQTFDIVTDPSKAEEIKRWAGLA